MANEDLLIRQMPHSLEGEQAVLGSMLIDEGCVKDVMDKLVPSDFYLRQNREIFETIYTMFTYARPIDGITVCEEMRKAGTYDENTTRSYLAQLMEITPTSANVMEYVAIVRDKALLRGVAQAAAEITALVQELGGYITSQHTSGTALEPGENGYGRSLSLTVRIPSDSLDAFLSQSEGVGVVQQSSIYEEDVTDQYFDTERRLEGYQTQYDRILALMDKAETVDELISIESELNRIYYQIESLTGSLQSWDARVNYSTVYYSLEEVRRASPVSLTLWERMQVSLQNTWDSIVLGSQNFVVWLYGALPALGLLLVLAGVAGLTVALCLRRRRRRAKAPKEGEPADGDKQKR